MTAPTAEPTSTTPSANDRQVGGSHYRTGGGKQHWDLCIEHGLSYPQSCASKYVQRHAEKNGRQDLEKAVHYLQKAEECHLVVGKAGHVPLTHFMGWTQELDVRGPEIHAMWLIMCTRYYEEARMAVEDLIELRYPDPVRAVIGDLQDRAVGEAMQETEAFPHAADPVPPGTPEDGGQHEAKELSNKKYSEMNFAELCTERKKLIAANEAATGWGAAVGQRSEWLKEIERQMDARFPGAVILS